MIIEHDMQRYTNMQADEDRSLACWEIPTTQDLMAWNIIQFHLLDAMNSISFSVLDHVEPDDY